jgi:hypothetical protein
MGDGQLQITLVDVLGSFTLPDTMVTLAIFKGKIHRQQTSLMGFKKRP